VNEEAATIDVGEAAKVLGVEPSEVYRAIDRGDLAYRKVGRRIRLDLTTIREYGTHR
jgi:excisionase family DNA binding protein